MKKVLVLLLCVCMIAGVMVGCTPVAVSEPAAPAEEAAPAQEAAPAEETAPAEEAAGAAPSFKIGFAYYSFADVLGSQWKMLLEKSAAALGCEAVCKEWPSMDLEGMTAANDALIQDGCNGIVTCLLTPAFAQAYEEAGISYLLLGGVPPTEMEESLKQSDYFAGYVINGDYEAGYAMGQALYDAACRSVVYVGSPKGQSKQLDDRAAGFEQFLSEHTDMKLLGSSLGVGSGDELNQLLSAYPEIDGIMTVGNDGSVPLTLHSLGLNGKVKYATAGTQADDDVYFDEGLTVFVADGNNVSMQYSVALLYNQMAGTPLLEKGDAKLTALSSKFIYMKSSDDLNVFMTNIAGEEPVYTDDEIRSLCKVFNPDATIDDLKALMESFSLEDVMARRGLA